MKTISLKLLERIMKMLEDTTNVQHKCKLLKYGVYITHTHIISPIAVIA